MSQKTLRLKFSKNSFEKEAWAQNLAIIGVDEVGRGCLAGPVVTAAVILPGKISRLLKDSKIMTPQERLEAYAWIVKNCRYSVGIVNHRVIDQLNIWHATLWAMKRAVLQLISQHQVSLGGIVVDAMPLSLADTRHHAVPIHHFPFGESKSSSIAAASIVAKVTRDRLMERMDKFFPAYHLAQHKGYSTREHKCAILQHGHSIIHRMSFLSHIALKEEQDETQQTIWGSD